MSNLPKFATEIDEINWWLFATDAEVIDWMHEHRDDPEVMKAYDMAFIMNIFV